MKLISGMLSLLALTAWLAGALTAQDNSAAKKGDKATAVKVAAPPVKFYVVNGSGDSRDLSESLAEVIRCRCLPWGMETICWTTGLTTIDDHAGVANHRRWGHNLAARANAYRQAHANAKIYLLGHSSGSHVALAAAECAPPGTFDRVVLLAASVSCFYDLRPALRACREGIDNFYSTEDGILDLAVDMLGSADGKKIVAAGQIGFRTPRPPFPEHELYRRLRQFPWSVCVEWTGHHGGHVGALQPAFLQAYVLPIALTPWTAPIMGAGTRAPR